MFLMLHVMDYGTCSSDPKAKSFTAMAAWVILKE
jgi:hypothetical protein